MTVEELLDELRDRDPSMEVVCTLDIGEDEFVDAPVSSAHVSLGRVFLRCGDE